MITVVNGNILNCKEDIICHQVNVQGVMGGGVAKQLANFYSTLEKQYKEFCLKYDNLYEKLKGIVFFYSENNYYDEKIIANIFSQTLDYDTDYEASRKSFSCVKEYALKNNKSIAIPYKYGCGIANGNWNIVYGIIDDVFNDFDVAIYKYEI